MKMILLALRHIGPPSNIHRATLQVLNVLLVAPCAPRRYLLVKPKFNIFNMKLMLKVTTTWVQIPSLLFAVVNKAIYIFATCIAIPCTQLLRNALEESEGASFEEIVGTGFCCEHADVMEVVVTAFTSIPGSIALLLAAITNVLFPEVFQLELVTNGASTHSLLHSHAESFCDFLQKLYFKKVNMVSL